METYVVLGNYTSQGITNIKESPARVEAAKAAVERFGGKWLGFWMTMGRYDFVIVVKMPSVESVATILLATGMQGNVTTETLRAFTVEETGGIIGNLP